MKLNTLKKQLGYSLIEVVAVTMTSGILTASALPHFINLKDEARQVVFKSLQRSVIQAAHLANAQQRLAGLGPNETIMVDGKKIAMHKGYPKAESIGLLIENSDFNYQAENGWFIWNNANSKHCRQSYRPPTNKTRTPKVVSSESGC